MKALGFVLILAAIVVPAADGHWGDTWYWSPQRAESKLLTSTRPLVAFNASSLGNVDCVPTGVWIWSSSTPKAKLYKHFDCGFTVYYNDGTYQTVERIVHVISAQDFVMSTL
jgi:hypothetical protein